MTPEAVRAALEAAIAAFLRALPTGNGYSPHDLAAAISDSRDEAAALRAERDALKRDNAYMGYVIHGPLLPEQEARATKIERDALRAENERLKRVLEQAQCCILEETPEYGTHEEAREDTLEKIRDALRDATIHAAPEYTREEMREACRNNYHAGAAVGELRADVAAMGNALADYFDNGSDYSTGAKVRAIAERQGAKNG
jgi:hypothetical protein